MQSTADIGRNPNNNRALLQVQRNKRRNQTVNLENKESKNKKNILEIKNLTVEYSPAGGIFSKGKALRALNDVSFCVEAGQTLGIVGESGCGKSTLAKTIIRLLQPTSGKIIFDGHDITRLKGRALKPFRRQIQMVFQDPADSLNPKHTLEEILREPLEIHRIKNRAERIEKLLHLVGIPDTYLRRYPHELSGGQRQRIGIARALALEPKLVICDEPVSALDLSIQSQIINLLLRLQRELGLTMIFISHDLRLVRHVSDNIAVLYKGDLVELGAAEEVYHRPQHAYTKKLLANLLPL
jgi:ABC-type glutathione transport system ATPase component